MKTPANFYFIFKLLKSTHFIVLSVIMLFLTLGSCESETVEPLPTTDSDADLHLNDPIKRLSLNEFLQTAIYKKVEQELEQRQSGSKSLSKGNSTPSDTGYAFVSDEVYEATSPEGQVTYTAAIQTTPGYNPDYSENLMIIETQEGPKIYIVKYPRDGSEKVFLQPVNTNPDDINTNSLNCYNRSWRSVIPCTGRTSAGTPARHTDPAKCSCTGTNCTPPKTSRGDVLVCILPPKPTGPDSPGGGNYGGSQNSNGNSNYSGGCDDPDCLQEPPVYIYEGEEECFSDGTCTPSLYWVHVLAATPEPSNQNIDFGADEIDLIVESFLLENNYSEEAKKATAIFTKAATNNLLSVPFGDRLMDEVYKSEPLYITDPISGIKYYIYVKTQIAIIKSEYPPNYNFSSWELAKIYMEANLEAIQIGLDVIGLIPVYGEVADLANGVIYTIRGDGVNATLSFSATLPIGGWVATGIKAGYKTATTFGTRVRLTWRVLSDGEIYFGSSGSKLRKVLGITDPALQAHHLMPWADEIKKHKIIQKAASSGSAFHINEALNGIAVAAWRNQPNHQRYTDLVRSKLDDFVDENPNASVDEAYAFVIKLNSDIRNWIINNPNSHLNKLEL